MAAATALRQGGVRTQLYGEKRKFKAKIGYADKIGVPFAVLLGEDEIAAGELSVKDMRTGEQKRMKNEDAAAYIMRAVQERNSGAVISEK